MPRYKLTIEYDGTGISGWQKQTVDLSVQQLLEEAVLKLAGEPTAVVCAGRTDAGVHALGQVAHVDLAKDYDAFNVQQAINFHLIPELRVAVMDAEKIPDDFHARFSATKRCYLYRIINRRPRLVVERDRAWHVLEPLDAAKMHEAAQVLVGHHDFSSFRDSACQAKSPVKTLERLDVSRTGNEIRIIAEARSFLHHQVRNMVGTLRFAGNGKWTAEDMKTALDARDRRAAGENAPPHGLYLTAVHY